ncbi:MAG: hypothetical protein HQK62_08640 [Desulfamplus sp.]|nr:hypothetical protein [Desulfamplus sp.]
MNTAEYLDTAKLLRSCISAEGTFLVGIHKPYFNVNLFRENNYVDSLGELFDGTNVTNHANFPEKKVEERCADRIYEIPNAFPFRGTTYINSAWADQKAGRPELIQLPELPCCSLNQMLTELFEDQDKSPSYRSSFFEKLPYPLKIALAQSTTDPEDLLELIPLCCTILFNDYGTPCGLRFKKNKNCDAVPDIHDHTIFELIANNPALPDIYKRIMVLKPGIQGKSEITAEWIEEHDKYNPEGKCKSHVFEYLRRNSYIPWGHFAANMADDSVRYRAKDLTIGDMVGMRHLYYQRTYIRLAEQLNLFSSDTRKFCSSDIQEFSSSDTQELYSSDNCKTISLDNLEKLRCKVLKHLKKNTGSPLVFNGSLWGWNFGFGYAQSGYRLHASHQQIHQQYAMIPRQISDISGNKTISCYACGDLVADFIESYRSKTGREFFETYIQAIRSNKRVDGKTSLPSSLIVYQDDHVILFAPKAQTSQWELQLMALKPCGNILEADTGMRTSLDKGILMALHILEKIGARMVSSIEFSKRFDSIDADQRIIYSFMPKLPESPGAFSEAQLRWINGHYPEDFALACKRAFI